MKDNNYDNEKDRQGRDPLPQGPMLLVRDTVQVWAANTTFHCMKYVFDRESHVVRRLFWLVVIAGLCYLLVAGYISQIDRYRSLRAITKDTVRFEDQLEFPAVTFCSLCRIQNNTWTEEWEKQAMDAHAEFSRTGKDARNLTFGNVSMKDVRLGELGRKMQVTADRLFYTCMWRSRMLDCSNVMKPHHVIHNHCYTFNYHEQRDTFVVSAIGTYSALKVVLFLDRDNCMMGDYHGAAGVKYVVHTVDEEPDFLKAPTLAPGFFHNIALTKHEKKLLPLPVKSFGETECLDTSGDYKNPLKYFYSYSMQACEQECYSNYANRSCGCVPYPISDTLTLCDYATEINCAYSAYDRFWQQYHRYIRECGCLIPCELTVYTEKASFAYIPDRGFQLPAKANISGGLNYSDKDFIRENVLIVDLYFDSKMVHVSEQILEYTQEDLAASFGGYLGLCIGASIMTLLELLEMIFIAIMRYCCRLGRARH